MSSFFVIGFNVRIWRDNVVIFEVDTILGCFWLELGQFIMYE
jgi:hypothetical protein